mmetsp:Transcript_96454/g.245131  ORF Transcript_96454/g.245131 Transcript_96454/m.245131 type:complete len:85 (+) Transcript_96454:977-1231(+)
MWRWSAHSVSVLWEMSANWCHIGPGPCHVQLICKAAPKLHPSPLPSTSAAWQGILYGQKSQRLQGLSLFCRSVILGLDQYGSRF